MWFPIDLYRKPFLFCNSVTLTRKPFPVPNMCIYKLSVQAPRILVTWAGVLEKVVSYQWQKIPLQAKDWSRIYYGAKLANEPMEMDLMRGCQHSNEENIPTANWVVSKLYCKWHFKSVEERKNNCYQCKMVSSNTDDNHLAKKPGLLLAQDFLILGL